MKKCSSTFSPIIAHLANLSFSEGVFPSAFKCTQITPIVKKAALDPSILTNYRPISNLSTISKILKQLYLSRLKPQVSPLCSPLQSAYRSHHSTETALIRIVNDMVEAADSGCATVLVALDLSAAFDTIDHAVLLSRLSDTFGVTRTALNWIKSYLTARTSFVRIGSISSSTISIDTGVPQGSVFRPLLFTLFTTPLGDIITRFELRFHQYADDTQICIAIRRDNIACVTSNLAACTAAVYDWLRHNRLALNPNKSEAAMYGTALRVQSLKGDTFITVADAPVELSHSMKSLGVTTDENLTLRIRSKCMQGFIFSHPWSTAIDGSRLDYCNAIFGWNIRSQPKQTAVCPEYSGPSCHGNSSS